MIDLVDTSEGDLCELLERHHVHRRGHGLLAPTLSPLAEVLQLLALPEPHLRRQFMSTNSIEMAKTPNLNFDPITTEINVIFPLTQRNLSIVAKISHHASKLVVHIFH